MRNHELIKRAADWQAAFIADPSKCPKCECDVILGARCFDCGWAFNPIFVDEETSRSPRLPRRKYQWERLRTVTEDDRARRRRQGAMLGQAMKDSGKRYADWAEKIGLNVSTLRSVVFGMGADVHRELLARALKVRLG